MEDLASDPNPVRWLYVSNMVQASPGNHLISDPTASPHASGIVNGGACACGLEAFLGAGAGPSAPQFGNVLSSRLTPAGEQAFTQGIIVVDADRIAGLEAGQIADYLAMITLAHVKPRSRFIGTDTILNLFSKANTAPSQPKGLRPWDTAYLSGLYGAEAEKTFASQVTHVAVRMTRELQRHASKP